MSNYQSYVDDAPTDFIIQSLSRGPVTINDMGTTLEAFEALDLTWEDPKFVKGSKGLARALQTGMVAKITRETYDSIQNRELAADFSIYNYDEKRDKRKGAKVGNLDDVEMFDLQYSNTEAGRKELQAEIANSGIHNDPILYARACKQAMEDANKRGEEFDARAFESNWARASRGDIRRVASALTKGSKLASALSGAQPGGKAYVAYSGDAEGGSYAAAVRMGNLNRDGHLNGLLNVDDREYYNPNLIEESVDLNSGHRSANYAEEIELGGGESEDIGRSPGEIRRF